MPQDRLRRLLPVCSIALALLFGCGMESEPTVEKPTGSAESSGEVSTDASSGANLEHGLALYKRNCSVCHGDSGLGNGTAAYLLSPSPRDFSGGRFLLGSNSDGMPSATDLRATLERGMPGSAMPPWDHLTDDELDSLVMAVRHLAVEGRVMRLMDDDEELEEAEAREIAISLMATGERVVVPSMTPANDELVARGRGLYIEHCSKCHDEDGRGRKAQDMRDEQGNRVLARDFTQGVFKGGSDAEIIALRILRGLHGSPMPSNPMASEDLWPIVHFVRTLVPPGVEERVKLNQRTLTAHRSAEPIATALDDDAWRQVASTFLPLTPLWWRPDRIEGVELQAIHDGTRLAMRLRWADSTKNDTLLSQESFGDGAALGFSNAENPPLFSMGEPGDPVTLWHWKAAWSRDAAGGQPALAMAFPGLPTDGDLTYAGHPGQDGFATGRIAGNPLAQATHSQTVEVCNAVGFGSLTTLGPQAQTVEGEARWEDGHWTVVFLRDLETTGGGDVTLPAGERVAVSFALWDGAAGDRNGQKCVSIWHELELAP